MVLSMFPENAKLIGFQGAGPVLGMVILRAQWGGSFLPPPLGEALALVPWKM